MRQEQFAFQYVIDPNPALDIRMGGNSSKLRFVLWNRQGAYRLFHIALLQNQVTTATHIHSMSSPRLYWAEGFVISNVIAKILLGE